MALSVKASYKQETHRFPVDKTTSFLALKNLLADTFAVVAPFHISYRDEDGDYIRLTNDNELTEFFAVVEAHGINPVRILLADDAAADPHAAAAQAAGAAAQAATEAATEAAAAAATAAADAAADAAARAVPQHPQHPHPPPPGAMPHPPPPGTMPPPPTPGMEGLFAGIAQIMSAAQNVAASAAGPSSRSAPFGGPPPGYGPRWHRGYGPPHHGPPHHHGPHHHGPHHHARRHGHGHGHGHGRRPNRGFAFGRGGSFDLSGDMGAAFAPLLTMLGPLMAAFSSCSASIMSRLQAVAPATRDAFHSLIATARGASPTTTSDARLAALAAALNAVRDWVDTALPADGAVPASRVEELVATVDARVRPDAGADVADAAAALLRAAAADDAVVAALRELRAAGGLDFDVELSHDDGQTDAARGQEGGDEDEDADAVTRAPDAPLTLGDRGAGVATLQRALTRLGYMHERMYARRMGVFGPHTRDAVHTFQQEFGLGDVTETGVYDATTAASLASVLEAQVPRAAATGRDASAGGDEAAAGSSSGSAAGDAAAVPPAQPPAQG